MPSRPSVLRPGDNERDGERLCGELVTQEFKEQTTGTTGDRVDRICEEKLEPTTELGLELLAVGETKVDGKRATVRTRLDIDRVKVPRIFQLRSETDRRSSPPVRADR